MKKLDKQNLKLLISSELDSYRKEFDKHNYDLAFRHLERIHIVSQPFPIEHTRTHLRMLSFAIRTFRPFEIIVQFVYSLFSFKFSLLNIFPQGNTGGANAISKGAMPIPDDLQMYILKARQ
jgi:Protein of unknown function (DUF3703)